MPHREAYIYRFIKPGTDKGEPCYECTLCGHKMNLYNRMAIKKHLEKCVKKNKEKEIENQCT
jgi:hypothetical protein